MCAALEGAVAGRAAPSFSLVGPVVGAMGMGATLAPLTPTGPRAFLGVAARFWASSRLAFTSTMEGAAQESAKCKSK